MIERSLQKFEPKSGFVIPLTPIIRISDRMDSLVDIDILNLGKQGTDPVASLLAETAPITYETEADLESYRMELKELQDEVNALKARKQLIINDIGLCNQFVERATLYTAAIAPVSSTPKTGSKWGVLKSSILARPEDAFTILPPNTVHLPVQPEFAKFFYLATKLEMARRTSKFLGIRAKGPRAEYVEKCAEMRSVIVDAATARTDQLTEDIAVVRKVNADAVRSTLSILEPPPLDRPFSAYFDLPLASASRSASPVPPPPPVPPQLSTNATRHASVSFAPFFSTPPPPPVVVTAAVTTGSGQTENTENTSATPRRRSILHNFRSRSYAASVGRSDHFVHADPAVEKFSAQVNELVQGLVSVQQVHSKCVQENAHRSVQDHTIESEDSSMYRSALQAHCAETLDSFHAEMEQKMQDCLTQCNEALARRNGPLSVMKGDIAHNIVCFFDLLVQVSLLCLTNRCSRL